MRWLHAVEGPAHFSEGLFECELVSLFISILQFDSVIKTRVASVFSQLLFKSLIVSSTFDHICNGAALLSFSSEHTPFAKVLESVGNAFSDDHIIFLKNSLYNLSFHFILFNFGSP